MKPEIKERMERIRKGEVPDGYKEMKVGIIPADWDIKELSFLAKITMGQSPDSSFYNNQEIGIPLIQGNADIKNRITSPKMFTSQITKTCDVGDIIMSVRAPVGDISKSIHKACMGRGVCSIKSLSDDDYLYHYLLFVEKKWIKLAQGSTFEAVNSDDIKRYNICFPLKSEEQEKIAEILSTWDKAIELKEKLIEEKKEFKRGLMQKLLAGEMRFPEFTDEWVKTCLNKIVEKINDKNDEKDQTIVTISAKKGFINQSEYFNKIVASKDLSGYYLIIKGDFAYNKSYSNGYPVGVIKRLESFEKAVVTTLYICFRIKDQNVSSDFLKYYFDSVLLNHQIKRIANEGGRAHGLLNVTPSDFFNIKIMIPDILEQEKIADVLISQDKKIHLMELTLDQLKEQKRGLMQLLLTGIVRVEVD